VNILSLGADKDGHLNSVQHHAVAATSQFEDHQEVVVNWSGLLYKVENASFQQDLAKLDIYTPGDMRAPGAPLGMFALESAMDELAIAADLDPLDLRLRNYADADQNTGKILTSKELKACYQQGSEKFGWSKRNPVPGSMREGRELIGWGMASGVWEAYMFKTSARVTVTPGGKLEIACATSDIGTGTYTILAQIGADGLGLAMADVTVKLGDTSLPAAPVQGGSWTAASAGSAVMAACETLRGKMLAAAGKMPDSPFAKAKPDEVTFAGARMTLKADPSVSVTLSDIITASGGWAIEAEETVKPSLLKYLQYSSFAHSAVFAEVRIDEGLGVIRVTRIVSAVAAGRILNPKTARSQIIGGVVWGIGMALHEEAMTDHNLGRIMNRSLAEYHVPVHADIHDIDVIFVDEVDTKVSPIGVKGLGEIGIVGTAAAIANAVHHATGKRIRSLPITIDKLLG
jgi:xanthine dehydrogenase YagR molybdenum-binding subunit